MILKIFNDYSYLETDQSEIKKFLWGRLRFKERNYFHNPRYKRKLWDGYKDFFLQDTGKFLTGLLPEVKVCLKNQNIDFKQEDYRTKANFIVDSIDDQFVNQHKPADKPNITLHDYQVDYINQVIKHRRGIIYAPTSAGKSLMMVGILKAIEEGTPALVLQNRKPLAEQNYEEIRSWGCKDVGMLWGGSYKPGLITVATVQSVHKIAKILPKFKTLIVDEIHDMMSKTPKAVYRRMTGASVRVALSATPFKFGETDDVQKFFVKGFFGPVLKTNTTKSGKLTSAELQERKILAKSHSIFYPIDEPQLPYDIYLDAVTNGIANNYHFHEIVTRLAQNQTGRTLILVDRIAHGDALHMMIPNSLWVQGKDDSTSRKSVINKLSNHKGNVVAIATIGIFNTGISCFLHNLINAAGGQAEHLIIQRMGRGLRVADDKTDLKYYDFIFKINSYLESHSKKRVKILRKEGHEVVVKDVIDF